MVPNTSQHTEADIIFITKKYQSFHFEYQWIVYGIFRRLRFGKVLLFGEIYYCFA